MSNKAKRQTTITRTTVKEPQPVVETKVNPYDNAVLMVATFLNDHDRFDAVLKKLIAEIKGKSEHPNAKRMMVTIFALAQLLDSISSVRKITPDLFGTYFMAVNVVDETLMKDLHTVCMEMWRSLGQPTLFKE